MKPYTATDCLRKYFFNISKQLNAHIELFNKIKQVFIAGHFGHSTLEFTVCLEASAGLPTAGIFNGLRRKLS